MLTEKLKTALKVSPFFYKLLAPMARAFRRARNQAKARVRAREINRFRKFLVDLPQLVAKPVFVKVGANDGITDDPCSDILIADPNWSGLLIEPVPYCFERLKRNFPDGRRFILEQVAVGASAGEIPFYYVDPNAAERIPNLPEWFDQIGSFDRNHIVKHLNGVLEPFIIEYKVKVCPLSDVLTRNRIQTVHLLHVDTEGHDYEVLKSVDFNRHTPVAIFIEHFHLSAARRKEMLQLLRTHGYSVRNCVSDFFAVNRKAVEQLQQAARQGK